MAPPSLVPLGLAAFSLPLGTNVIVTTLICVRIWYLSPRKARNMPSAHSGTGRAAIDIVVESGMLYLAVQLIFVVLFAIGHPAQGIAGVIAVQIYVRIPHPWKAENRCKPVISQNHTGHRANVDSDPCWSWHFKYAERTDSQWASIVNVATYVVDASSYRYIFVHGTWPAPSRRDVRIWNQIKAKQ